MTDTLSPTNRDRAEWADEALQVFMLRTECDVEDCLTDLLADLMHWADANNTDFREELDRARMHYEAELAEEADVQGGAT